MGTRADFYVGKGKSAEWIGSIAWDGYRAGIDAQILGCKSEEAFRHAVANFLAKRDDATLPEHGWPWPWNTSATTDCHYWFFDGQCWEGRNRYSGAGEVYVPADEPEPDWSAEGADEEALYTAWQKGREEVEFPDMSGRKNITLGRRSGVIVIGG
jgi:hypothetical protein